jgi:transcriptional regulator with PAS, ATPase and Fis domain
MAGLNHALSTSVHGGGLLRMQPGVPRGALGEMVGCSPAMQRVFTIIQQIAPTSASALITGESGTGKEIVAQTIHQLSPRRDGPFIAINCAALPESLMESELFGYEKGAFTGAAERRPGRFEVADGGTLFLDEVAEMHPSAQAKLLRVLEDQRVRRLSARNEIKVDVRVLAATNKVPEDAIRSGHLRADLYYRLNVFEIQLPPVRDRKQDLPLLAMTWLELLNRKHGCSVSGIEPEVMDEFQQHDWPGNVRELRNVLERAVIVAGKGMIAPCHLSSVMRKLDVGEPSVPAGNCVMIPIGTTVAAAERQLILRTLEHTRDNKTLAASMLGISRKTLYNKLTETRENWQGGSRDENGLTDGGGGRGTPAAARRTG